jgi:hypothetical protein
MRHIAAGESRIRTVTNETGAVVDSWYAALAVASSWTLGARWIVDRLWTTG